MIATKIDKISLSFIHACYSLFSGCQDEDIRLTGIYHSSMAHNQFDLYHLSPFLGTHHRMGDWNLLAFFRIALLSKTIYGRIELK